MIKTTVVFSLPMIQRLGLLALAFGLQTAVAQSQGHASAKAKPVLSSDPAKARAAADLTAQLQARAIAEAQSAAKGKASPPTQTVLPATPQPMQALPAWNDVQPARAEEAPVAQSPADTVSQDLVIAQQIHQGLMPCEMGASVRVEADATAPGYFHVHSKGMRYRMYPVHTSTGALRLEDKKAGAVWLQLANKSMLMDQKRGRRLADECANPEQLAYGQTLKTNPPPSLLDTQGMGR